MKRSTIVILCIAAGVIAISGGVAAGVTFASYTQSKTFTFNSSSENITVRDIAHYFAGGTGASGTPYEINSPTHLRNLAKLQNAGFIGDGTHFALMNSFNWSGDPMEPIGTFAKPWNSYFKGNCRTITGLKVEATRIETVESVATTYSGMFGYVGGGHDGMVQNICLSSPYIDCKPASSSAVVVGFAAGHVAGITGNTVKGVMVYGGNENSIDGSSNELVARATIRANANSTVTSVANTSTKSVIIGGTASNGNLGILSFVAHIGDLNISGGDFSTPTGTGGSSSQGNTIKISGVSGAHTYKFYRNSSGTMVKVVS